MKLDPVDVLSDVTDYMVGDHYKRWPSGGVVARMSPERREALSRLKSEDVAHIRPKPWQLYGQWHSDPVRRMFQVVDQALNCLRS